MCPRLRLRYEKDVTTRLEITRLHVTPCGIVGNGYLCHVIDLGRVRSRVSVSDPVLDQADPSAITPFRYLRFRAFNHQVTGSQTSESIRVGSLLQNLDPDPTLPCGVGFQHRAITRNHRAFLTL